MPGPKGHVGLVVHAAQVKQHTLPYVVMLQVDQQRAETVSHSQGRDH